jgi:hypothetical protein
VYDEQQTLAYLAENARIAAESINARRSTSSTPRTPTRLRCSSREGFAGDTHRPRAGDDADRVRPHRSGKQSQAADGRERTKTWVVTSGAHSRHPEMNGETVPVSENFSNGLAWPGDGRRRCGRRRRLPVPAALSYPLTPPPREATCQTVQSARRVRGRLVQGGRPHKGEFEALVSVFGNVDYGGDRVVKGAFAKSLARWEEKGDPIPVIWNHMWENPEAHIGKVNPGDAAETDDGLLVKGTSTWTTRSPRRCTGCCPSGGSRSSRSATT